MANTPQTLALLALGQELRGQIVPQVNRLSATLRVIKIVPGRGQNVAWGVEGDSEDAEFYNDGADAANFSADAEAQAILAWARVRKNFTVTETAKYAALSNAAGPEGLKDLIGHHIVTQAGKVASAINAGIFSGAGTTNLIAGLDVAIADDSNTYATIVRGSSTYWRPTVVDPGSLTLPTFALIRSDRTAIYKKCGEMPDLAFCAPEVFDTIGELYDSTRRYVKEVTTPRGRVVLDAGFEGLELDGMTFLKDKDATANRIYYVNSSHVELECLPLAESTMEALRGMGVDMSANDGFGPLPLGMRVEKLAKLGASDRFTLGCHVQLKVRRPNSCGTRLNVQTV